MLDLAQRRWTWAKGTGLGPNALDLQVLPSPAKSSLDLTGNDWTWQENLVHVPPLQFTIFVEEPSRGRALAGDAVGLGHEVGLGATPPPPPFTSPNFSLERTTSELATRDVVVVNTEKKAKSLR